MGRRSRLVKKLKALFSLVVIFMLHEERTHWLKYWRLISQRSSRLPEWTRPCSQEWTPAYPVSHRSSQGRGQTPWEPAKMRDKLKSASTKTTFKVSIALTFIPHAARAGANGRDTYIIWVKFILILLKFSCVDFPILYTLIFNSTDRTGFSKYIKWISSFRSLSCVSTLTGFFVSFSNIFWYFLN